MTPNDTLLILSPPLRLVNYLERLFAAKQANGDEVPDGWWTWLERWKAIRSAEVSELDYLTIDEWNELEELAF